uniref:C-type lectin domain-containing protein n=1 Tax=Angiostrongylus cantonensis TaxID=6313 RepID=A0A0K0D3A1_ANGCA
VVINHNSHQVPKEWIQAPNGFLYQFHSGYQSWLAAREFCLSQNSDLVTLRDKEQINWLLSHYAPTYPRFSERFVQIGLLLPDGASHNWTYVNGSNPWISGEPFDHSVDGKERCGLLRVHSRLLDDVDCELVSRSRVRFICERDSEIHKQQQRSGNYLWRKVEQLMKYFQSTKNTSEEDYSDKVRLRGVLVVKYPAIFDSAKHYHEIEPEKLEQIINTMEKMLGKLENMSFVEKKNEEKAKSVLLESTTTESAKQSKDEEKPKQERGEKVLPRESLVGISEVTPLNLIMSFFPTKASFFRYGPTTDIRPENDEDCDDEASDDKIPVEREEHVQEFLHTLRTFLNRAEHSDLRKLLDNNSGKTLLEKMKLAIAEANEREFNRLKELEVMKKNGIDVSNKNPEDVEMRSSSDTSRGKMSEKKTITEKGGKEVMFVGNRGHMGEQDERPREVDTKSVKVSAEQEVKKEANVVSTEEKIPLEKTQEEQQKSADDENTPMRAEEAPTRTVQLKEFDDRNEIMSGESETVQKKENDEKTEPVKKVRDLQEANESVDINLMSLKSEKQEKTEEQNVPREGNNRPSEDHGMSSKPDKKSQDHEGGQPITASSEVRDHDSEEKVVTEIAIVDINAGKEKNDKNYSEEEVGTERAPVDNDGESKQEINEKEMIKKVAPEESDINNPLGLPTLPPPPTLPPLPTLKELFDNLTKEWKKLFKHPKSLFKL